MIAVDPARSADASRCAGGLRKAAEAPPPWKVIDASTLRAMMASDKGLPVFNTMSEIECLDHRIPGSKCLACEEIENNPSVLPADKERVIVFYCESAGCYRSCRAADAAVKAGYRQVHVLEGGMPAWKQAGYSMETIERIPRGSIQSLRARRLSRCSRSEKTFSLSMSARRSPTRKGTSKGP